MSEKIVTILLITVAIVAVISGALTAIGAHRKEDGTRSKWFFVATVGVSIWALAIMLFALINDEAWAPIVVAGIYIGPMVMDTGLLGYNGWKFKFGRFMTIVSLLAIIIFSVCIIMNPGILYQSIDVSSAKHLVVLNSNDTFYKAYVTFFISNTAFTILFLCYDMFTVAERKKKYGKFIFLLSIALAGTLALIFDLILPPTDYSLIWIGPLAIGMVLVCFYFVIVHYEVVKFSARWLRTLSYILFIIFGVAIYLIALYLLSNLIFGGSSNRDMVWQAFIFANVIIGIILIAIFPLIRSAFRRIAMPKMNDDIDDKYIIKKLNKYKESETVNLNELAAFMTEYVHYSYFGFVIDGKVYGSLPLALTDSDIKKISDLGPAEDGIWQKINSSLKNELDKLGIKRVAALKNENELVYGQLLVGKFLGENQGSEDEAKIVEILKIAAQVAEKKI